MKTRRGFLGQVLGAIAAIPLLTGSRRGVEVAPTPVKLAKFIGSPIALTGVDLNPCARCNGSGTVEYWVPVGVIGRMESPYLPDSSDRTVEACSRCDGTGVEPMPKCVVCGDTGFRHIPVGGGPMRGGLIEYKRVPCPECKGDVEVPGRYAGIDRWFQWEDGSWIDPQAHKLE